MNKLLIASVAVAAAALGGPAFAADLPYKAPPDFEHAFTWSSCYAGGHVGGGWARKDVTDPAQLVQDSFLGLGSTAAAGLGATTVETQPTGLLVGGQFGCDYQFTSNGVVGFEGSVSGATLKGSTSVGLPLGNPGDSELVTARADILSSATVRLGYAADRVLMYVKGGAAWAGDKYSVVGTFQGTGFDFEGVDLRTGWTAGGGVEWALWDNWSVKLEYDYYDFGHRNVMLSDAINVFTGPVDVKQTVQTVKLGLNFHVWSGQ